MRVLQAYTGDVSPNAPLSSLFNSGASDQQPSAPAKARRKPLNTKSAAAPAVKKSAAAEKKAAE